MSEISGGYGFHGWGIFPWGLNFLSADVFYMLKHVIMSSDTTLTAVSHQIEQECQQVNLNLSRKWKIFTNVPLSDSKLPILIRSSKKEPYHACKLWLSSVHFCGKVLCATLMLNGFSKAILPIFRHYFFSDELRSFRSSRMLVEMVFFLCRLLLSHTPCGFSTMLR